MSKDSWKLKYRELNERTYAALWLSLLRIGKVDEALLAAEQGRAQTLSDNLLIQFKSGCPQKSNKSWPQVKNRFCSNLAYYVCKCTV